MFVCLFNSDCCRNISSNTECIDICTAGRIFETTQSTCASDIDKMLACAAGMLDIDKMLTCAAGMFDSWNATDTLKPTSCQEKTVYFLSE